MKRIISVLNILLYLSTTVFFDACSSPSYHITPNYSTYESMSLPEKPLLLFPGDNSYVHEQTIAFQWQKAKNAVRYAFVLALDQSFMNVIFSKEDIRQEEVKLINFQVKGTSYFWRVCSINVIGIDQCSDPGYFVNGYPKTLPAYYVNSLENVSVNEKKIIFAWEKITGADMYEVQVAQRYDFSKIWWNQKTEELSIKIAIPIAGSYWARMRARYPRGWGEWSKPIRACCFKNCSEEQKEKRIYKPKKELKSKEVKLPDVAILPLKSRYVKGSVVLTLKCKDKGSLDYQVQISKFPDFSEIWYEKTAKETEMKFDEKECSKIFPRDGSRFYVRARAGNKEGWGKWSQKESFYSVKRIPLVAAGNNGGL